MIQGLYQSAAASAGLEAWNDAIARNISSATSPGFKKSTVSFEGIVTGALASETIATSPHAQSRINPETHATTSFQPGEMRRSGDPLEFAIDGSGFFRLQKPDGSFVYTRDGQFRVANDGRLVSKQGYDVASDAGAIQFLIDGGPVTVDAEGRVRQGDQEVGVLSVFDFEDPGLLQRTTGGYAVDPDHPQDPDRAEGARIKQGFLESSNVSAIREMADLVAVNNSLQANQRVIQTMDTLTERAVQILGNTAN